MLNEEEVEEDNDEEDDGMAIIDYMYIIY